ncbi:hypothetical protein RDWZM_005778 [Blomia tropicalis]|uniref:MICOS complex subunit MIC10 n=1 Tax=Blomia tropicalis TaxID=40697 RepID=A0A9Q0RMQ7_BLOTA|nr:Mitochondrial inner membrane organizing system component [Blomia tropicalis]KAJ6219966.1 hypothetical protein RDWZM_005778 [Blomia tropicalis]
MAQVVKSENSCCQKYDKFVANAITSTGVGLGVGTVLSLIIFKRRMFPIHYGIGIGLGYALKDLELDLNRANAPKCPHKKPQQ